MILLEHANRIVEETVLRLLSASKPEAIEMTVADFDGVQYHVFNEEGDKSVIMLSMSLRCIEDLVPYGVADCINGLYGAFVVDTEAGYDVTLRIPIADIPEGDRAELAHTVALLKRNLMSVPFEAFFDAVGRPSDGTKAEIHYRPNESIWLMSDKDKCTVVFSIEFADADDVVFGKVFLQEFKGARRKITAAPPVEFNTREPPLELQDMPNLHMTDNTGFVTFVFFPGHFDAAHRDKTISTIITFRNYLQYHIKCAKAYLHTCMRKRVVSLLQILNRAKMEPKTKKAKKTASGRTFRRN